MPVLYDFFWSHCQADPVLVSQHALRIETKHVLRAYDCVTLSHDLLSVLVSGAPTGPGGADVEARSLAEALSGAEKLAAAMRHNKLPESQFERFEVSAEEAAEAGQEVLTQSETPALREGLGPSGESVQEPAVGTIIMSDRAACFI